MEEIDYSTLKGVAEEKHFDICVDRFGGERVDPLITRPGVKKADYLFRSSRVVAELKVLETEFSQTDDAKVKFAKIKADCVDLSEDDATRIMLREAIKILRTPIQRIVKKANTQLRETKQELGLTGFEGILLCVNDNFKGIPPAVVLALLSDILAGKNFRSIRAVVYITNHHIEHPDSPDALLLWYPIYSILASDELQNFINKFGRAWFDYSEKELGTFSSREERESFDLRRSSIVTGVLRNEPYLAENPNMKI